MLLVYFVLIPIVSGVLIYTIPKMPVRIFAFITEFFLMALAVLLYIRVNEYGSVRNILGAQNSVLGIMLVADMFKVMLLGLSIILFFLALLYTTQETFLDKKFIMLFLILQGLLCGVFLSDDLFNLYVLLEVATVVVAILIMFKRDICSIYDGMIYLMSQVVCMVFYLFGIGYMYKIFGVLSIEKITQMIGGVDAKQLVLPFAFIMTAVCLKSAFFPLFSWLPRAHGTPSAPSSVSAILSGLYVKNGIYLFTVFFTLFSPALNSSLFFIVISSITAVCGILFAIIQTDIKLILAYSTVSQIGLIALSYSTMNDVSAAGAMYHVVCHAIFKALLFLCAGMVIKRYNTRDVRNISGVLKTMPIVSTAIIIGILGITGAPLLNGSISKYFMMYGAKGTLVEILMYIINFGTIFVFVKYSHMLLGKKQAYKKQNFSKSTAITILSLLCVLGGVFGVAFMNTFISSNLKIDIAQYLEKTVIYVVFVVCAIILYKFTLCKHEKIFKLNKYVLNFQQIIMAMLLFFIGVILCVS